jgi:ABC-type uncharacterized transport system permease subunit
VLERLAQGEASMLEIEGFGRKSLIDLKKSLRSSVTNFRPLRKNWPRSGAITYVALSQGMIAFLFIFGSYDIMQSVYTGSIGADLLRPMPLFWLWMARDLGARW